METLISLTSGEPREALRGVISYSHQDRKLVEQVERVLRENGLTAFAFRLDNSVVRGKAAL